VSIDISFDDFVFMIFNIWGISEIKEIKLPITQANIAHKLILKNATIANNKYEM